MNLHQKQDSRPQQRLGDQLRFVSLANDTEDISSPKTKSQANVTNELQFQEKPQERPQEKPQEKSREKSRDNFDHYRTKESSTIKAQSNLVDPPTSVTSKYEKSTQEAESSAPGDKYHDIARRSSNDIFGKMSNTLSTIFRSSQKHTPHKQDDR